MTIPKPPNQKIKPKQNKYLLFKIISVVGIIAGVIVGFILRWTGDDIYIGLRYVRHFLNGEGLVYNVGERIEGYTDFLWLMIIALFQKLNFDPAQSAIGLGLFFLAITLTAMAFISFKINAVKNLRE